jgi:hypothetical protein
VCGLSRMATTDSTRTGPVPGSYRRRDRAPPA